MTLDQTDFRDQVVFTLMASRKPRELPKIKLRFKHAEGLMASKSSKELTKELAKLGQFVPRHGRGKLNTGGTPGHKGGSGRPPDKLKAFWASVLNGAASQKEVRRVLENADHPAFASLYAKVALHLVGVPTKAESREQDNDEIMIVLDL